jgi:hypothetical protein
VGVSALALAVGVGDPLWIGGAGAIVVLGALAFAVSLARVLTHLAPTPGRHLPTSTLSVHTR